MPAPRTGRSRRRPPPAGRDARGAGAELVVDDWGQCRAGPFGALRAHVETGKLTEATLHAELCQIVVGDRPGREKDDETILFWHRGLSLSDIALGHAMLEKARRLGIGQALRYARPLRPTGRPRGRPGSAARDQTANGAPRGGPPEVVVGGLLKDEARLVAEAPGQPAPMEPDGVVESIGPAPIPPVVVARGLSEESKRRLVDAFLSMHEDPEGRAILADGLLARFVAVQDRDYDPVRATVRGAKPAGFLTLK